MTNLIRKNIDALPKKDGMGTIQHATIATSPMKASMGRIVINLKGMWNMAKVIAESDIAIFSFPVAIIRWLSAPEAPDHRVTLSLDSSLRGFALRTQSGACSPQHPRSACIFQHHHSLPRKMLSENLRGRFLSVFAKQKNREKRTRAP